MKWIRKLRHISDFIYHDYERCMSRDEILNIVSRVHEIDETIGKKGHKYITALEKTIIERVDNLKTIDCNYWDLFCFRQNSQDDFLREKVWDSKKRVSLFGKKQLVLLLKVIEMNDPKIIVLPNKGAADILDNFMIEIKKSIYFNRKIGTHIITVNHKQYPIFLSANIHTRNPLDKYSKDRLGWHINHLFNM